MSSFLNAHCRWEREAHTSSLSLGVSVASTLAAAEYEKMLSQFCDSNVKPQPISFGDPPAHDPAEESIQSVSANEIQAVVTTEHIDDIDFTSLYEYHLVRVGREWRLKSLLYVDDDGKYECL